MSEKVIRRERTETELAKKYLRGSSRVKKFVLDKPGEPNFQTSPLNKIKLDIDWIGGNHKKSPNKLLKAKKENHKFFLSKLEKTNGELEVNKQDKVIRDNNNGVMRSVNSKELNSISFLSNRIQKEFFMSIEIKRLVKRLKTSKERDAKRFLYILCLCIPLYCIL